MISKNLKNIRLKRGLTQRQLGKSSNIGERTIRYIEGGTIKNPKLNTLQRLSNTLDVTIEELIK